MSISILGNLAEFSDFGIAVAAFIGLTLAVGVISSKMVKKSGRRLIVAGKSLPLAMVGTMLAAQAVDGNSSLGNIALVFEFGFWAGAAIPIGLGVCLLVVGIGYAKKLNKMSMITLPDFYFRRFGNGAEGISGVLLIISFTILVAGNLAASGFILEVVFGIDYFWGILISALVVVAYTIAGGLFASAWTNLFQVYLAIGAFWAGFIYFAGGFSGTEWDTITSSVPPEFLDITGLTDVANGALLNWAAILALGLGDIIALDFMERVFAARDPKTAQKGAFMGGALTLFTVLPTSMLGIAAFYFLPADTVPDLALPLLATEHMPFAIGAAILMGVIGASMSTASGGLLAISSVISRNFIQRIIRRRWLNKPGWSDNKLLVATRIIIVPMMVAGTTLGYFLPAPGIYLILAFDVVFAGALAPLTLGLFWSKANMPAAIASLIVGSVIRFIFFLPETTPIPEELAGLDTMIPPVISFALFIVVAYATQGSYPGKARHGVIDYVPPEEDMITGNDLKNFAGGSQAMPGGTSESTTPHDGDDDTSSHTAMGK